MAKERDGRGAAGGRATEPPSAGDGAGGGPASLRQASSRSKPSRGGRSDRGVGSPPARRRRL